MYVVMSIRLRNECGISFFKTFSSIIIIRDPFSSFKNFLCAIRISKRHQSTKHSSYIPINSDENYLYSGFVVYCDEDTEWVVSKFLKIVEGENGAKLCIHHRDFEVGKLIVDNIAENIAQSKKIILLCHSYFKKTPITLYHGRRHDKNYFLTLSNILCNVVNN
jgi:hypothetical protein